jgi:hypothetical protein
MSRDGSVESDDESFAAGSRNSSESEEEDDDGEDGAWKDGDDEEDENKKALCMYATTSMECGWDLAAILMLCRHCDADEEHDPASDYEEALECSVCGAFGTHSPPHLLARCSGSDVDKL